jgi:flagellar basal-body rod protein FlgG
LQIGSGTRAVATAKVFTEGELTQTGERLDVAIQGDGFFQVTMPDGTIAYTRDGALKTNSEGQVITSDGLPVQGGFQPIPAGTTNVTISSNGAVTTTGANGTQNFQMQLVRFANPAVLQAIWAAICTHKPRLRHAGNGDARVRMVSAAVQQGYLEMSNVKVVEEMVNMIVAQRAYEVNSKAVQSADEMMQESNNLRH